MGNKEDHRRQAERHRVRFHLVYDDGSSFNAGTVRDVSEGGLFLETALPLPIGTEVRLTPLLADANGTQLFEVRAKVARSIPYDPESGNEQPAGMGLQFIGLSPDEQTQVVRMIKDLQAKLASFQGERDPFLGIMVPSSRPRPSQLPAGAQIQSAPPPPMPTPPETGTPDKS
jgi:uncharacterized protein (TIGR02266 family)